MCRTWTQENDLLFLLLNFDSVSNSAPENFANIWRIERDGIRMKKFWSSAISLFKWRTCCCRRPCCLSSLPTKYHHTQFYWNCINDSIDIYPYGMELMHHRVAKSSDCRKYLDIFIVYAVKPSISDHSQSTQH